MTDQEFDLSKIRIEPRVVWQLPKAHLSSQYLCGTDHKRSEHITLEINLKDSRGRWKTVRVLIDCGATSIFVSPRLVERLGLQTEPAKITTFSINGQVLANREDSRKVELTARYMPHRSPVTETDVLVVPIQAYDMVLGTP